MFLRTSHTYPASHTVLSLAEQVRLLAAIFPELPTPHGALLPRQAISAAEGLFAVPRWCLVAPTYGEAVAKVVTRIGQRREYFCNYLEDRLTDEYLRPHDAVTPRQMGADHGSFVVLHAQFGARRHSPPRRTKRWQPAPNEYALGAFAVGCMLLLHPNRLADYDDLWLCCPGDSCRRYRDQPFTLMPCWQCVAGELGIAFDAVPRECRGGHYGWVTAFAAQPDVHRSPTVIDAPSVL